MPIFTEDHSMPEQIIHTHALPNGLTVVIEPMCDVQSAAFALLVPGGSGFDPVGQNGTASVLTDWITRGAGDLDSRELSNAFDSLGVQHSEATAFTPALISAAGIPNVSERSVTKSLLKIAHHSTGNDRKSPHPTPAHGTAR